MELVLSPFWQNLGILEMRHKGLRSYKGHVARASCFPAQAFAYQLGGMPLPSIHHHTNTVPKSCRWTDSRGTPPQIVPYKTVGYLQLHSHLCVFCRILVSCNQVGKGCLIVELNQTFQKSTCHPAHTIQQGISLRPGYILVIFSESIVEQLRDSSHREHCQLVRLKATILGKFNAFSAKIKFIRRLGLIVNDANGHHSILNAHDIITHMVFPPQTSTFFLVEDLRLMLSRSVGFAAH
nr:MAG TPA: hypothetical protein [Caudoviricetes sp.]